MTGRFVIGLLVLSAACKAGEGEGTALGPLYILNCNGYGADLGSRAQPAIFDLKPGFFAAEPIEEGDKYFKINRLIIRLQPNGRSRELNDVLTFNLPDSREVARCVRGGVVDGKPDYDQKNCMQGPNGPRLRVAPDALVRGSLAPFSTCVRPVVGTAIDDAMTTEWDSWLELSQFGSAVQAARSPETRDRISADFKVDIDEPLIAPAFLLDLIDDATLPHYCGGLAGLCPAQRSLENAQIAGTLQGSFSFALQRGQGAQTFP
jgi:hypothetical protein